MNEFFNASAAYTAALGVAFFIKQQDLLPGDRRWRVGIAVAIGLAIAIIAWLVNETPWSGRAFGLWLMQAGTLIGAALGVFYEKHQGPPVPTIGPPQRGHDA